MSTLTTTINNVMSGLNRYRLAVQGCDAPLDVESFTAREQFSATYRYQIRFTSRNQDISLQQMLRRGTTFQMQTLGDTVFGVVTPPTVQKVVHGVVTDFRRLSGSLDEALYQITLEPFFALLDNQTRSYRFFLNQSIPEIVEQILREHNLKGWEFEFQLKSSYPRRAQVNQVNESDKAFIERLLAEVGIFYTFALHPDTQTEILRFGDRQSFYQFGKTLPLRNPSGMNDNAADSVWGLSVRHKVVEQSVLVKDYNYREAHNPLLSAPADMTRGEGEKVTYGEVYHYQPRHLSQGDKITPDPETANFWARLDHERMLTAQTRLRGYSTDVTLAPGQVLTLSATSPLPDAFREEMVITAVRFSASRSNALQVIFTAIPYSETLCYRPPLKPRPVVTGTLMARVTSPIDNDLYAHLDKDGLYWVRFDSDRDEKRQGYESMPVRLAKPYGGDTYGIHFPLIQGAEVAIAFHEGDPDRPYIAHAMHDSRHPDHVTERNNTRNVIRTPANNKLRMEDRRGEEHVKLSTDHSGKSQLNLGHIVDAGRNLRGKGAELRTDAHLAIRGGDGVFISADRQQEAEGPVLEMAAMQALLSQALSRMESLSQSAQLAKAQVLHYEQQQKLMEEKLLELKQAVLLASAPEGVAVASGGHLQMAASDNIYMTSGQSTELGSMQNISLAAAKKISLFTESEGVETIAAKGDLISQAQSGNIDTVAKHNISLTSTSENITLTAAKTLTLNCAGGAYIRLSGGNIELGCPGDITMKQSKLLYSGPASLESTLPELPSSGPHAIKFMLLDALGNVAPAAMKVKLFDSDNKENLWSSRFDDGETGVFELEDNKRFHAIIGDDAWTSLFTDDDEVSDEETDEESFDDEHGPQYDDEFNTLEEE
ncbi:MULTISPECIES: type VI secretion system Vgr family protein [unclassified Serratia (in: enterobacteria)]|uniref:type VI secretion system Vgr family protein n=1 Tax=unclassified Serratia (in: enterobacteria) TaxID=2647522 RepID=UPI003076879B